MAILGLTGSLASGKSTVLKMLQRKGAVIFDVDKKIHQYYRDKKNKVYKKIAKVFPEALKGESISRKALGQIVFSDKSKLKGLEDIVHPAITAELIRWIKKRKGSRRIYLAEVPLLFEKRLTPYFDKIILVSASEKILIKRAIKKYNISRKEVLNRLGLYLPFKNKIKESDFVVNNNFSFKKLKKEVDLLWLKIRKKPKMSRLS